MARKVKARRGNIKQRGTVKTTPFDIADYLKSPNERAEYFNVWIAEDWDAEGMRRALSDMVRATNVNYLARRCLAKLYGGE